MIHLCKSARGGLPNLHSEGGLQAAAAGFALTETLYQSLNAKRDQYP